jgi:hypothetical protein
MSIWGAMKKRLARAMVVATPVFSQVQMVRANWVIVVPRRETNWPAQMMVKAVIPMGLWLSVVIVVPPTSAWAP